MFCSGSFNFAVHLRRLLRFRLGFGMSAGQARAWTRRTAVAVRCSPRMLPAAPETDAAQFFICTMHRPRYTCSPSTLHVRLRKDHYPHDERSPRLDDHVVLPGDLEVGSFHRSGSGPSEGRWSWAYAIGTDDTTFAAGGYAAYPEVCRTLITLAFRRTLARADLSERPDAKPGPPNRARRTRSPSLRRRCRPTIARPLGGSGWLRDAPALGRPCRGALVGGRHSGKEKAPANRG